MGKRILKDEQCFMKYCENKAIQNISYFLKKVKVCKKHVHLDMLHEHNDSQGRYSCRCKKGKV